MADPKAIQNRLNVVYSKASPLARASTAAAQLAPFLGEVDDTHSLLAALQGEGAVDYTMQYYDISQEELNDLEGDVSQVVPNILSNTIKWLKSVQSPLFAFFGMQHFMDDKDGSDGGEKTTMLSPWYGLLSLGITTGADMEGGQGIVPNDTLNDAAQRYGTSASDQVQPRSHSIFHWVWAGYPQNGGRTNCAPDGVGLVFKYEGPNQAGVYHPGLPKKLVRDPKTGDMTPNVGSSAFQWQSNSYGPMNRQSSELGIFLNHMKAVDFSKCVPYFDMKLITPGRLPIEGYLPSSGINKYPSMNRFFVDEHQIGSSLTEKFQALAQFPAPLDSTPMSKQGVDNLGSTAGMESFVTPQSILNLEGNHVEGVGLSDSSQRAVPILDRMRAFASVKDFSVKIEPQLSFMTFMTANLNITLHDRSRLADIAPLVKPEDRGGVDIMIEWGWASAGNDDMIDPIATFLNGCRQKAIFNVSNSSYSFTDDGQVEISVALHSKGPAQMTSTSITEGWKNKKGESIENLFTGIKILTAEISELKAQIGEGRSVIPDILGADILNTVSSTSSAATMLKKDRIEISKKVKEAYKAERNSEKEEILKTIQTLLTKQAGFDDTVSSAVSSKVAVCKTKSGKDYFKNDPYWHPSQRLLQPVIMEANNSGRNRSTFAKPGFASFAEIVYRFVAAPLENTLEFDEVQCHFYNFNSKASFMADQPLSAFPICLSKNRKFPLEPILEDILSEQIKKGGGLTVAEFLGVMNHFYFNNSSLTAYGFSSLYEKKDGKTIIKESKKSSYKNEIDNTLAKAYGTKERLKFVKPQIACMSETLPSYIHPDRTILKLHFYDANARKFDAIGTIFDSFRGDLMGTSMSTTDIAATKDRNPRTTSFKKLKDPHGKALIDEMVKRGYVETIEVPDSLIKDGNRVYYKPIGGPKKFYELLCRYIPSIVVGKQTSVLKSISLQSMSDPRMASLAMLESLKKQANKDKSQIQDGVKQSGMPERIQPVECSFETLGCPFFAPYESIFIDFSTGTTAEDLYTIGSIEHKLTPGDYSTSIKCYPRAATSSYTSIKQAADDTSADMMGAPAGAKPISGMSVEDLLEAIQKNALGNKENS